MKQSKSFIRVAAVSLLASVFTAVTAWAETEEALLPSFANGNGTEGAPYEIANAQDWDTFTQRINEGIGLKAYYKLTASIDLGSSESPLETVVGCDKTNCFQGYFDGGTNTITVNISRTSEYAGLFGVVKGATFCNLTVEGTLTSTRKYIGSIAAYADAESTPCEFVDCTSRVTINCLVAGDGSIGGLLGHSENGKVNFQDCVFAGEINGVDGTEKCGGFINYAKGSVNYNHCLMAGTVNISKNFATFNRGGATKTFADTYYINNYGDVKGASQAIAEVPAGEIYRKLVFGSTACYLQGKVQADIDYEYPYLARPIAIEANVKDDKKILAEGADYELTYQKWDADKDDYTDVAEMNEVGDYIVFVNAKGNYAGSIQNKVHVYTIDPTWVALQDALASKSRVALTADYLAGEKETALVVSGSVVLDLNGHTISRGLASAQENGYVILVENKDAELTILDSSADQKGAITGGWNKGNGGGIVNNGTLKLYSGNISGNRSEEGGDKVYGTGGGIMNEKTASFFVYGGSVSNNTAVGGGAGIYAKEIQSFSIEGGEVKGNESLNKGAGIRVSVKNARITKCTITGNVLTGDKQGFGAGIYHEGYNLTVEDCLITDNVAGTEGGGLYTLSGSGSLTLINCNFARNESPKGACFSFNGKEIVMDGGFYHDNVSTAKSGSNLIVINTKSSELELENQEDLDDLAGLEFATVVLNNRTLYKDGDWNTLCLPFDVTDGDTEDGVSFSGTSLEGAVVMELDVTGYYDDKGVRYADPAEGLVQTGFNKETGDLALYFTEVSAIEAGKPYLIKWAKAYDYDETFDLQNPVFSQETIVSTPIPVYFTGGSFVGNLNAVNFTANDKTKLLLGLNNKLFWPNADMNFGACRAYFDIEFSEQQIHASVMNFTEDEEATSIDTHSLTVNRKSGSWYTLDGRQLEGEPAEGGLYFRNGRKLLVK